jgi:hypothetical protein
VFVRFSCAASPVLCPAVTILPVPHQSASPGVVPWLTLPAPSLVPRLVLASVTLSAVPVLLPSSSSAPNGSRAGTWCDTELGPVSAVPGLMLERRPWLARPQWITQCRQCLAEQHPELIAHDCTSSSPVVDQSRHPALSQCFGPSESPSLTLSAVPSASPSSSPSSVPVCRQLLRRMAQ